MRKSLCRIIKDELADLKRQHHESLDRFNKTSQDYYLSLSTDLVLQINILEKVLASYNHRKRGRNT